VLLAALRLGSPDDLALVVDRLRVGVKVIQVALSPAEGSKVGHPPVLLEQDTTLVTLRLAPPNNLAAPAEGLVRASAHPLALTPPRVSAVAVI